MWLYFKSPLTFYAGVASDRTCFAAYETNVPLFMLSRVDIKSPERRWAELISRNKPIGQRRVRGTTRWPIFGV